MRDLQECIHFSWEKMFALKVRWSANRVYLFSTGNSYIFQRHVFIPKHVTPINTNWSYTCILKEDISLSFLSHLQNALEYCQLPKGSYCNCGSNVSKAISSTVYKNKAIYVNI